MSVNPYDQSTLKLTFGKQAKGLDKSIRDLESATSERSGVGAKSAGEHAEVFNDYERNVAGGKYSHASGYDSQLESMTDAKGYTYTYSYDLNGNRVKTTYPDGTSISSTYDARGRVKSNTDQNGYSTSYSYDGADRLTSVTDALGNVTSYTYDEVGNLTTVTDANTNVTRYNYDDFGRVVKTTNALGQISEFTYDSMGNILTATDYAGKQTTYAYDNFDRISSKTTSDGTVSYSHTVDGKLESVQDSTGTTTFTYNGMDGLSKVVYPDRNYVEYSYDDGNRLTKTSTAYGETAYEYDLLERVVRIVGRNGLATVYEYDANGNRSAVRYANGITVTYEYDEVNRLINEKTLDKDSRTVAEYVYALGLAGERIAVTEIDKTIEYTYDELYRLVGEKITDSKGNVKEHTYAYDDVSNRILKTENGVETVYTYNALNQLIAENDTTYEYDNAGNLVRTIAPTKSALYEYNAENKLIKATVQNGVNVTVEQYTYDFAGNRTSKSTITNGIVEITHYLNDISGGLTQVLAELDADGDEKCFYTRGFELISQERDGEVSYYLTDGHGSVRQLANENGNITDTYTYDAWGNLTASTGDTVNTYLYCGEQFNSTTGLYYLRARYMNPSTGTFTSMDTYQGSTFDPITLHKYLYANANPVMNCDPSGYMSIGEMSATMGMIGALSSGLISIGMNILRNLDETGEFKCTLSVQELMFSMLFGYVAGATFGGALYWAVGLKFAAVSFAILGSLSLVKASIQYFYTGEKWQAGGNLFLSILSFVGAFKLAHQYDVIVKANDTAKTATDNSTSNTNAAQGGGKVVPDKVRDIANQVKAKNGAPPQGYKGGKTFNNQPVNGGQKLPDGVNYKEYDVNPYIKGQNRGMERIVIGDDGTVWYTNDHYHTFTKIE